MADYALGFVSGATVTTEFFNSVLQAFARDHCSILSMQSGPLLHKARNELAAKFLDTDERALLMVDSDIEFTVGDIDRIMAHDEPLVSGVYRQGSGEVIEDGCGFLRIDRRVLEVVGPYPFNPILLHSGEMTGEDVGFRYHAEKAGYPVVIDRSISVGHVKASVLTIPALVPA